MLIQVMLVLFGNQTTKTHCSIFQQSLHHLVSVLISDAIHVKENSFILGYFFLAYGKAAGLDSCFSPVTG